MSSHSVLEADGTYKLPTLKATVITLLVVSFLNPHTYLDTIVLLGSIGAQFDHIGRLYFGVGAILSSFIWFFTVSYGARYLAPLFKKPFTWKILDFFIGIVMWSIAGSLVWN